MALENLIQVDESGRICPTCNQQFIPKPPMRHTQKFCSRNCFWNRPEIFRIKTWHDVNCHYCNKLYKVSNHRIKVGKEKRWDYFCSQKCQSEARRGFSFYEEHYFCDSCYAWIKKDDAKMLCAGEPYKYKKGVRKTNQYRCPKCDNKLTTRKRAKGKKDRRNKVYIE